MAKTQIANISAVGISEVQANVLGLFRDYGAMDDYTLINRYRYNHGPVSESTPRTRRRELADLGILRDTGLKTIAESGRWLSVWGLA